MLGALFSAGVGIYTFYALQPYLLDLYGDPEAYSVAGLAAAIVAGAQIVGGYAAPRLRGLFRKRTSALLLNAAATSAILLLLGVTETFAVALALLTLWGLIFAANMPIRQAYLNGMIPSRQRATVLSFDSLMGSAGGVVIQPVLGRTGPRSQSAPASRRSRCPSSSSAAASGRRRIWPRRGPSRLRRASRASRPSPRR
jgi:MFS family permease